MLISAQAQEGTIMKNEFKRDLNTHEIRNTVFSFSTLIVPILLVVAGLWISTQTFAALFKYDPHVVGYPSFIISGKYPLYFPWMYAGWCLKYWPYPDVYGPYFSGSNGPVMVFSGIAFFVFLGITLAKLFFLSDNNFFGTARWANIRDIKKNGFLQTEGVVLGELYDAEIKSEVIKEGNKQGEVILRLKRPAPLVCHAGRHNTLGIAPTGSGKGISWATPTALSFPESMFIFDPKAQLYEDTAGFRSKFSRIFRFSPTERDSLSINILKDIPPGDDAFRYAQMIAEILTSPKTNKQDETGEYFSAGAQELLTAGILHVICSDYFDKSFYGVKRMFVGDITDSQKAGDVDASVRTWIDTVHCNEEIHERVANAASTFLSMNEKEKPTVLRVIYNALLVFDDPVVRANTTKDDFSVRDFWESEVPVTLYFTIAYSDIPRLSPLLRILVTFILRRLSDGKTGYGRAKLKHRLLFLLDEFSSLGQMKAVKESMSIMREYNVFFFIICQSITQLNDLYGKDHPFLEHCKTMVVFAPGILSTAEEISRICGKRSTRKASVSNSMHILSNNPGSISESETENNLINADELMKLPPDEFLLFHHGMPPYNGKKVICYDDVRFKNFIDHKKYPAPANRAELLRFCTIRKESSDDLWFRVPQKPVLMSQDEEEVDQSLIDDFFKQKNKDVNVEVEEVVSPTDLARLAALNSL
jgi:type IV secretion system protein VirD4